jgi:hypothetical protein
LVSGDLQGLDDGGAVLNYLAGGVALLLGLSCLGVAGEALRHGRIWYRSKNRPDRNSRWVHRSTQPVEFWLRVGILLVVGVGMAGTGVFLVAYGIGTR